MTACLFRSGSSYYSLANQRHYDAWGAIRSGAISGDPKGRYCASLGHKQDDESGLVYMRARYYEPSSGRFLSEDPDRRDMNFLAFAARDPVNFSDSSGRDPISVAWAAAAAFVITFLYEIGHTNDLAKATAAAIVAAISTATIVAASNAIDEAAKLGAIQAFGAKLFDGGFVNMASQVLIDCICQDTPGSGLFLAFMGGGGGLVLFPGFNSAMDAGTGSFMSGLAGAVANSNGYFNS